MAGQEYVWRVEARSLLKHEVKLDRVFKNKVEALQYQESLIRKGYKKSTVSKYFGK